MSEDTTKTAVETEIEQVVQSVNEWDDRTSPDDYPDHLLITSEELADILRNFAETTLHKLQLEVDAMRTKAISNAQERNAVERENEKLQAIVDKVNDIRNSIIGCQTMNWSEHIYPLVAALEEGGIKGAGYPEARKNMGTLIERTKAAEAQAAPLRSALKTFATVSKDWVNADGWTDVACQNDRIVDWFGPSDFRTAQAALNAGASDAE